LVAPLIIAGILGSAMMGSAGLSVAPYFIEEKKKN